MSLFIAEDGSALEKLCLLLDGVEGSARLGSRMGVGTAVFLRGGGGDVIHVVSTYLGGRGLLGGTGGRLAKLNGGGA